MFIVAPCYKAPKKKFFGPCMRPKLVCPRLDRDLLDEARALFHSDNLLASAMVARVAMERELTTLAMSRPDFGVYWRGIYDTANWLHKHGLLRKKTHGVVMRAAETGNAAAHGGGVEKYDVQQMFVAVDALRATVKRKVVAA